MTDMNPMSPLGSENRWLPSFVVSGPTKQKEENMILPQTEAIEILNKQINYYVELFLNMKITFCLEI